MYSKKLKHKYNFILTGSPCLDLSRPPPGFGPTGSNKPISSEQSIPLNEIYYNLPAGLMLKLIKTEDFNYEPLDSKLIKLPALEPPAEKLLKAIDEFYLPVSPTKPRNK